MVNLSSNYNVRNLLSYYSNTCGVLKILWTSGI